METPAKNGKLLLPAIRGQMGKREFVSCVMPVHEVCARVQLAHAMSVPATLSPKMQADISNNGVKEISDYLHQKERFFNSLVVAVCDGEPTWHGFKTFNGIGAEHKDKMGILSLTGEEKMYALDGQHRLLGLRQHLQGNGGLPDQINLILISHNGYSPMGVASSRRLFTNLNKRAQPMSKRDIISLDEDDAMAIITRILVEEDARFTLHEKIFSSADNHIPADDGASCFTTIGALYECLEILFPYVLPQHNKDALKNQRVSDRELQTLQHAATRFFAALQQHIKPFADYHKAKGKSAATAAAKYRTGAATAHLLFHPQGLKTVVSVACAVYKHLHEGKTYDPELMNAAIAQTAQLPMQMAQPPLKDVVWDGASGAVKPGFSLLARIFKCKLMSEFARKNLPAVASQYQKITGAHLHAFLSAK